MFTFRPDDPADPADPVSRTERRSQRRRSADRKRLVIAGGAVGATGLAVIVAMLLSSSPASVDHALPAPTAPAAASSAETAPSAPPSGEPSASADGPSPTRSSARPSPTASARPTTAATVAAPPAPPTTTAPTSAPPSSSAPVRTLRWKDTGPDVTQMQLLLMRASCDRIGPLDRDLAAPGQPGFGRWTEDVLSSFQRRNRSQLKNITLGVYDPQTRAVLEAAAQNPDC
jgi:hypothetical protein